MAETAKWYVVHTYSGYENAVAAAVMKAAENRRMTDLIHEVKIPMETVTEFTDAGEKTVERKVFPGYVLIKMILTDDSWHLVHNVRGATGFVGADGKAIPLTEQEIYAAWQTGPLPASSARSRRSTWRAIPSVWLSPCSAGRLRWSWSLTRSNHSRMSDNKYYTD